MVDVNKESAAQALQLLNEVRIQGKIRKGTNEVTKSIERGEAKLVVIAADVNPPEIIMHLPILCGEKNIPHVFVDSKAELGAAAGLPVGTSAIAVANAGDAAKKLADFVDKLKGKAPKPVKIEAKVEAPKAEAKAEEKPKKPRAKKETKEVAAAPAAA